MVLGWRKTTPTANPLPSAMRLRMEELFRTSFSSVAYKLGRSHSRSVRALS